MGVYRKVPKAQAAGKPLISTRWVDTDKGTEQCPNYRSRLVGREITRDNFEGWNYLPSPGETTGNHER